MDRDAGRDCGVTRRAYILKIAMLESNTAVGSELGLNKQEKDKSRNFGRKIENAIILCNSFCS